MKEEILKDLSTAIKTYWPESELLVPLSGNYTYERYIFFYVKDPASLDSICLFFNNDNDEFSLSSVVCRSKEYMDFFKQHYHETGENIGMSASITLQLYITPYGPNDYWLECISDDRELEADIRIDTLELIDWIDKGFK